MAGGRPDSGSLSVPRMTRQLAAEGVGRIVLVSETPEKYGRASNLAPGVEVHDRDYFAQAQDELAAHDGVSALIFDQTCAAEKRRRRKRGLMTEPELPLFHNDTLCNA